MSTDLEHDHRDALLERVERRGRQLRRRRRLGRAALGATMLILVAGVTTGIVLARGGNAITQVHSEDPTPASTAPTAAAGTTSVTPSWLPTGSIQGNAAGLIPPVPFATDFQTRMAIYQLPGPANADTMPPGGFTSVSEATSGEFHPGTTLDISFTPGISTMPALPGSSQYMVTQQVSIGGFAGQLSFQSTGYGVARIDWLDPQGYHSVLCQRYRTASGTSGLSNADLIRVADSLYTR